MSRDLPVVEVRGRPRPSLETTLVDSAVDRSAHLWSPQSVAYMYILRCSDGSYYVGSTRNLESRLWQHQQGLGAEYTKHRLPVDLVYAYEFERVVDAFAMEKRVQGWSRKKREALIRGDYDALPRLASRAQRNRSS